MISDADMTHLKNLARLSIDDGETIALKDDLNKILEAFEQLKELDTDGVEELVRPVPLHSVFREDVVKPSLPHKEAMQLATEEEDGFFKVPRTVDADG